ncbi:MAG: hypothetical protein DMG13_25425 [Acidobacteria bacterium]|nr:MAG: hypothetical protein DMG13_25425 [Acidobacteriota bacterium]
MIKFDTPLRVVYTLGVSLILSLPAAAQSVLNFARTPVNGRFKTGLTVTNPTPNYADVQFTFYGFDGNPVSSGLVNPVRYRIAPKGQISMLATDIFAASKIDGWVQATSPASGLIGSYISGDFASKAEASEASPALTSQVIPIIPIIRNDQINKTDLLVLNPGTANSNVTITFFTSRGEEAGTVTRSIASHAAVSLRPSTIVSPAVSGNLSARISSSVPVAAVAAIERDDALMFAGGQAFDQLATVRITPHFISGNGFNPVLILTNPNASPIVVTVTLFSETGGAVHASFNGPSSRDFLVPANGSISVDTRNITGLLFVPSVNGWLRVDSPNVVLSGVLILDEGQSTTAIPLQTSPMDRMIYSLLSEVEAPLSRLVLVNTSAVQAGLDISLVNQDGTTTAQTAMTIPARSKFSSLIRDLLPQAAGQDGGYVFIRSSVALYGIEILGDAGTRSLASLPLGRTVDGFSANPILATATITQVEPGPDVKPGTTIRVDVGGSLGDATFLLGDQVVPATRLAWPGAASFFIDIPAVEPGFVNLRMRTDGMELAPVPLHILPADNLPLQVIEGQAFYQKIDVGDAGLDLSRPVMVPIRNGRVEVVDRSAQSIVAVSQTDGRGQFRVPVPAEPDLTIRVMSRLRSDDLRVADNTNGNALYGISLDIDAREPLGRLLLVDNSRVSGAFNILEMLQRGNDAIRLADPKIVPPPVSIFWSSRNTPRSGSVRDGLVGTTFFNFVNNTAFVLGDRAVDSDEFDDSVIVHEYAHMLAARFSRDDSPGHVHGIGDMLDPRVAWSEGWANFFSGAVRNDPIYRDSMGPNGANILRYDLEDNIPPGDKPGYWSEASVQSLLWDLYDDHVDPADNVQFPLSLIWSAFADLKNDRFVYLPYFLDHFLARNPAASDVLRTMVQFRSIDFQPNVRPSVTNPFPRPINVGDVITGEVDSLTSKRTNLVQSSHFMSFTTTGGAASIRLEIAGLGPGDNPEANDLDLFLMDVNGRLLDRSDRGLNGESELISLRIPAGTYVVEVRSYYTKAETGGLVFNSGRYRLSVLVQ